MARPQRLPRRYLPKDFPPWPMVDQQTPSWISRKISRGQILLEEDACYGCYLFPKSRSSIEQMKRLKSGMPSQVSFPEEHSDVESTRIIVRTWGS